MFWRTVRPPRLNGTIWSAIVDGAKRQARQIGSSLRTWSRSARWR